MPSDVDLLLRIAAAAGLGAVLGAEREHRGQFAGMRTHALVAAGAAIFTVVGAYGFSDIPRGPNIDPMRIAAQVASGIGFIGGGAIIHEGALVRGLTTAATLWAGAALGLAAGAGLWLPAAAGLGVVLVVLLGLPMVRDVFGPRIGSVQRILVLDYERGHGTLGPVLGRLSDAGARLTGLRIDDELHGRQGELRRVQVEVRVQRPVELERALADLVTRGEVRDGTITIPPS